MEYQPQMDLMNAASEARDALSKSVQGQSEVNAAIADSVRHVTDAQAHFAKTLETIANTQAQMRQMATAVERALKAKRVLVRGPDGRPTHSVVEGQ
jgi:bifunctional pyridoxal-dependent enzyme with beta-cystathionase and maltose regulon repressor activities